MKNLKNDKFIFDNVVLSNFARIEMTELIFSVSRNVYTTREIIEEVHRGIPDNSCLMKIIELADIGKIEVISPKDDKSILMMSRMLQEKRIQLGEASAIALALEKDAYFLSDDKRAKRTAVEEGARILVPEELKIEIAPKNLFKDTVIILELLKKNGEISVEDYEKIRSMLAEESFIF